MRFLIQLSEGTMIPAALHKLSRTIPRIFHIIKGWKTSSTVLKKLCEQDLKLKRASPRK
jgi:hypothetical protein